MITLLGLDLGVSEPVSDSNSLAVDKKPDRLSGGARNTQRFPLIVLDQVSLQANKLTIKDQARSMATPIVISDLQIGNTEGIKILGDEPDTNPLIKLNIHGRSSLQEPSVEPRVPLCRPAADSRPMGHLADPGQGRFVFRS
jgi:hypothetical protein